MKQRMRKRTVMKWKYFIAFVVSVFAVLPILSRLSQRNDSDEKQYSPKIQSRRTFKLPDSEYTKNLTDHLSIVFNIFWPKCKGADEIRHLENGYECINTYGLGSLALESLETLYVANQNENYEEVSKYVKENYDCEELGSVDIREFWTRYIGSFIGAYQLTEDRYYLNMATKCSKLAIDILNDYNETASIINMKERVAKKYAFFLNATTLSESTAGLPELMALYKITRDTLFLHEYSKRLAFIPLNPTMPLHAYYDPRVMRPKGSIDTLSGEVAGFFSDILIANELKDVRIITNFINSSLKYIEFFNVLFSYDALLIQSKAEKLGINEKIVNYDKLYEFSVICYPPLSCDLFKFGQHIYADFCFRYESTSLRWMRSQIEDYQTLLSYAVKPLDQGYETKCHGLSGKIHWTDVTSSNVIGQWLLECFLILTNTTAVVNENNHVLEIKQT
jgi:hypothetical protein